MVELGRSSRTTASKSNTDASVLMSGRVRTIHGPRFRMIGSKVDGATSCRELWKVQPSKIKASQLAHLYSPGEADN